MRNKTFPVQLQSVKLILPVAGWRFDLLKAVINMAPENGIPPAVQFLDRPVPLFQPSPESILAQWAEALSAQLVGDMPEDHCRMMPEPSGQFPVDGR